MKTNLRRAVNYSFELDEKKVPGHHVLIIAAFTAQCPLMFKDYKQARYRSFLEHRELGYVTFKSLHVVSFHQLGDSYLYVVKFLLWDHRNKLSKERWLPCLVTYQFTTNVFSFFGKYDNEINPLSPPLHSQLLLDIKK